MRLMWPVVSALVAAGWLGPQDSPTRDPMVILSQDNTVEKLFAEIRRSLTWGQHRALVEYDSELGFPVMADLNPVKDIFDEELYLRVTGFRKVQVFGWFGAAGHLIPRTARVQ